MEDEDMPKSKHRSEGVLEKTKARVSKGTVALCLAIGLSLGAVGITGASYVIGEAKETSRTDELISSYTDDGICAVPCELVTNRAYDTEFTTGSKLVESLEKENVDYLYLDGKYYSQNGGDVAILTFEVVEREEIDACVEKIDGVTIYLAPEGYTLDGNKCYKDTTNYVTKVVAKKSDSDYSEVTLSGYNSYSLINVNEVTTDKFSSLNNYSLICDVADDAVLDKNGQCPAVFTLKKNK